tara:strand:- start:537 stop:1295 length:759 start_codon:yes stop_codon:yes gene_type:complete
MNIQSTETEERFGLEHTASRSLPYQFAIKSWSHWCKKNNAQLFVLDELLLPMEEMGICWQRYYLFDILEANDIKYDQVLMVDSDTIVHPDCPNFFEHTEHKYCGVHDEGSYDWILRSIENYSKHIFEGKQLEWWKYINGGFQIVNKRHKEFFNEMKSLYHNNKENFIQMQDTFKTGTDQTPVNFMLQIKNIETKLLPYEFNMTDMPRKEILNHDLTMTKIGWVYHFNCIPNNKDNQATYFWMEKTYKELYEN